MYKNINTPPTHTTFYFTEATFLVRQNVTLPVYGLNFQYNKICFITWSMVWTFSVTKSVLLHGLWFELSV